MDPYSNKNRKILSPLDKKPAEEPDEEESSAGSSTKMEKKEQSETDTIEEESEQDENENAPDEEPGILEHLGELRKQIIKSIAVFLLFFIVAFSTINFWFPYVTRGHELVVLSPMEVISFYTMISAFLALGLSVPFLTHFSWQFIKPGLKENEGRFLSLYSPVIFILFLGGTAFGYYVVNPLSYNFLITIGAINFEIMISAQEYARFLLLTTVPIGLIFELPVVALFLSNIGILTSATMKKFRKWSYIILAVFSALITPPDFFSQLLILIPMIGLYEGSIYLVSKTEKRAKSKNVE